jgi:uncharacterized protein YjaG (DUF416 family)
MPILRFDERGLLAQLRRLPNQLRVAFAAACAERQLPNYISFSKVTGTGNPNLLTRILFRIWEDIEGSSASDYDLHKELNSCMSLLPNDEADSPEQQAYANDAVASVAYTIRARLTDDCREALWAARRAYEALDRYVIAQLNPIIVEPDAENRIVAHPLIQAELRRQRADLSELQQAAMNAANERNVITDLHNRSQMDAALFLIHKLDRSPPAGLPVEYS